MWSMWDNLSLLCQLFMNEYIYRGVDSNSSMGCPLVYFFFKFDTNSRKKYEKNNYVEYCDIYLSKKIKFDLHIEK